MKIYISIEALESRKIEDANKYLFIFHNKQIADWYKRYLKREDVIYMTTMELEHGGIVGLRYRDWCIVDESMTKQIINARFPIIGGIK